MVLALECRSCRCPHSATSNEMSQFWSCLCCPQATWSYWVQCVGPAGRREAVLAEHPLCSFPAEPSGEAGSSKGWTWRELLEEGGSMSIHTGCFHVQRNFKPDEEHTWPLSFREMGVSVLAKDRSRDRVYNSCSDVWHCVLISWQFNVKQQSSWLLKKCI